MKACVTVVGSLNIDLIASVDRLPAPGQTVPASRLIQRFGGKGANQAVAAARQGAFTRMIGCVGTDASGESYVARLNAEGIATDGIDRTARALTGTALIAVDGRAENLIVVAGGANSRLSTKWVRKRRNLVRGVLLLQFEVPMPCVTEAARLANQSGFPVVLNPSPLRDGFPWGRLALDTLVVNEGEAEHLFKANVESLPARPQPWRTRMGRWRIRHLVVTRGARPTILLNAGQCLQIAGLKVKPVDTVGAGDAFAGAYAARRAEGCDVAEAIRYANCAGALATLKPGAQEAIPSRAATGRARASLRS